METAGKADFTTVYTQPDPRAYYESLRSLDYEIPAHGCQVFSSVIDQLPTDDGQPTVLDLCCSYGINAALLNHSVSLEELEAHYAAGDGLSREALVERDRSWFAATRRADAVGVVGIDVSEPAISYASDAGLLSGGIVADLETERLSDCDATMISNVDLVTVTGGIGYVNERTFEQILDATDDPPWVAALSLRWIDFEPIAKTLDQQGLVTEKLDGYLAPQRRFADHAEEAFVMEELASLGVDPSSVEQNGYHCAELYVARPADAVDHLPLDRLLDDLV